MCVCVCVCVCVCLYLLGLLCEHAHAHVRLVSSAHVMKVVLGFGSDTLPAPLDVHEALSSLALNGVSASLLHCMAFEDLLSSLA